MEKRELILEYKGHLTFSTIGRLLTMLKYKMVEKGIDPATYKRILSVMIEALENVYKYSDKYYEDQFISKNYIPYFTLEKNAQSYLISVSNPVRNEDSIGLKSKIDTVNGKNYEELRMFYRQTISNGKFSEKGGAGMGIIEMAKISGNKLNYRFTNINESHKLYTLSILFN